MYEDESFCQENWQIRECVIPKDTIKIVKLDLGPGENGIVIDYEENQKKKTSNMFKNSRVIPLTMRKYILYLQFQAS